MMGFGGYGNGVSYPSPSSSNLSASAPPFTLDRSPKTSPVPLVDLTEPSYSGPVNSSLNNWLSARASTSDLNPFPPPSNSYGYGGSQTVESSSVIVSASPDSFGYGQSAENVAKQYYPPFAVTDHSASSRVALDGSSDDFRQRSLDSKYGAEWGDGLWNGFVEWKQGKEGHGSFNSKKTDISVPSMYENYMNPDAEISKGLNNVDFLGMEKFGGCLNQENLNGNTFVGKTSSFVPDDFSRSVLGSLSGLSETQPQSSSLVFGPSSSSHQLPYGSSSGLELRQCANDGISHIMQFHSLDSSTNKPVFNSSHLGTYPKRDNSSQDMLIANTGPGLYYSGHDRFTLDLNINEALSTIQESSETVDHYNHAVDSPCWKGVPVNRSSPFDASEALSDMEKLEPCNYLNFQTNKASQLTIAGKVSPHKPNENTAYCEVVYPEHSLDSNLRSDFVASGDHSETKVVQHSGDNYEYGSKSDTKNSHSMRQSRKEGEDVNEIIAEALQYCSSRLHVPVEHVISSSVDETSCTKPNSLTEGPSSPTIDVAGLVNTIHNLSNFLLHHCTKGSSQLKQKDQAVVQCVINNLKMCIPKNSEKSTPIQEPILYPGCAVDICQETKGSDSIQALVDTQNGHKGNKIYTNDKDNLASDSLPEGSDCNMVDEDKATQAFKKVLMENFNEEETQPHTLLYKNLWLEAEAALCSLNYKARYNRIKIEMDGSKLLKSKDAHEDSVITDIRKPLGSVSSLDSKGVDLSSKNEGCSALNNRGLSMLSPSGHNEDVLARFQILRCRIENSNPSTPSNVDKPQSSLASPHSGNVPKLTSKVHEEEEEEEEKTSPKLETSTQASSSDLTANKDINEFDASVMARFQILKSRAENIPPSTEIELPRFASQSTYWPNLGSKLEIGTSGPNPAFESTEAHLTANEFQMYDSHRPENSDWEHVRKEDLAWQHR